jgi:hypothetical protein
MNHIVTGPAGIAAALALVLCCAGVGTLFAAWRRGRDKPHHAPALSVGWLFLLASAVVWAGPAGGDRGTVFAILATGIGGLALIGARTAWDAADGSGRREHKRERGRGDRKSRAGDGGDAVSGIEPAPRSGGWGHGVAVFLVAGPLSAAAATSAALALLAVSSATVGANRLVAAFLSVPLLWAGAMLWSCCDSNLRRPAAWLAGTLGVMSIVAVVAQNAT